VTTAETIAHIEQVYGRRIGRRTLFRWLAEGITARGGERVKLGGVRVGGLWAVTPAAVAAFVAALTDPAGPPPVETPAERRRASAEACRRLAAAGWLARK
jgi:hypothetical protein